ADDRARRAILAGPGRPAELLTLRGAGHSAIITLLLRALHRPAILLRALHRPGRPAILVGALNRRSTTLLAGALGADRAAVRLDALHRAAARLRPGRCGAIRLRPVGRTLIAGRLRHRGQRPCGDDGRQRDGEAARGLAHVHGSCWRRDHGVPTWR